MNATVYIDSDALIREVTRYLAAVDVFRAEKCEPMWRAELFARDSLVLPGPVPHATGNRRPETRRP